MKNGSHIHSFSVDSSCDCGVMLSDLVRTNAALVEALEAAQSYMLSRGIYRPVKKQVEAALALAKGEK